MLQRLIGIFILSSSVLLSLSALAVVDIYEFDNEVDRQRYQSFVEEMRCPKCQNQNLAGSNSPIAEDLRRELHLMLVDGKSDKEIVDFMVNRYGDYVLYNPRVQSGTWVLWYGPVALFLVGLIALVLILRRKAGAVVAGPSPTADSREGSLDSSSFDQGSLDQDAITSSTSVTEDDLSADEQQRLSAILDAEEQEKKS